MAVSILFNYDGLDLKDTVGKKVNWNENENKSSRVVTSEAGKPSNGRKIARIAPISTIF